VIMIRICYCLDLATRLLLQLRYLILLTRSSRIQICPTILLECIDPSNHISEKTLLRHRHVLAPHNTYLSIMMLEPARRSATPSSKCRYSKTVNVALPCLKPGHLNSGIFTSPPRHLKQNTLGIVHAAIRNYLIEYECDTSNIHTGNTTHIVILR